MPVNVLKPFVTNALRLRFILYTLAQALTQRGT
jgi:hypothetical protein